jgi:MFS family permease
MVNANEKESNLTAASIDNTRKPWWRQLSGYHWFVFAMASLAWLFDCLDQQIFILARGDALKHLLPPGTSQPTINEYAGYATSIFVCGWATGGMIFGSIGDRIGRAKTLTLTVLIYSVFTGLSAFSQGWIDFAIFRFLTGLGVGGVFGLAVALVADSLPSSARTGALGFLQALSALGNITAGLISMGMGKLVSNGTIAPESGWKYMFLVGALPAFLCVFIQIRLREPEKWVKARAEGKLTGVKFGSYASLFGEARYRRAALLGMMLCVSGVIGLWGIGFFSPELVRGVITESLVNQGVAEADIAASTANWMGVNSIFQNTGAFIGMLVFTWLAQAIGRKPAFVIGFIAAMLATIFYFQRFQGTGDVWMSGVMGACQLGLFAGFAIYLPELFPLRLRSTGTSFCYNVGRFLAASGPITFGLLQRLLVPKDASGAEKLDAFRDAASYMSVIFLVGIVAILFLPETKGRSLPEE